MLSDSTVELCCSTVTYGSAFLWLTSTLFADAETTNYKGKGPAAYLENREEGVGLGPGGRHFTQGGRRTVVVGGRLRTPEGALLLHFPCKHME